MAFRPSGIDTQRQSGGCRVNQSETGTGQRAYDHQIREEDGSVADSPRNCGDHESPADHPQGQSFAFCARSGDRSLRHAFQPDGPPGVVLRHHADRPTGSTEPRQNSEELSHETGSVPRPRACLSPVTSRSRTTSCSPSVASSRRRRRTQGPSLVTWAALGRTR